MEESDLICRLKARDPEALRLIYERYSVRIYNLCRRFAGNREDAVDLSQEAFLRMYEKVDLLREESSFSSWFFRLTANIANDWLRSRKRLILEDQTEVLESALAKTESLAPGALEQLSLVQDYGKAQKAVESLPDGCRQVFVNCTLGLSHREIAEKLGISEETSRAQFYKARKKLVAILTEMAEDRPGRGSRA